jgi:cellulose synthase/poly-beta-1,6-N-acetylglucosamine synthase-like glycosyltransferase
MPLLLIVLAILAVALWLPNLVDLAAVVVMLGRRNGRRRPAVSDSKVPRLLFLVPAHNEEQLIAQCVSSLVSMDYPIESRRIVVIADNSSDGTARLAREAGAECVERFDDAHRGKPHAIAWALRVIGLTQMEACVIVDADTIVAPGFARGLARATRADRCPGKHRHDE